MTENKYKREVAYRITSDTMKELVVIPRDAEDEYAPQYFALPDGTKINRVFIVGTLIELEDVGSDVPFWRARVSDKAGHFNVNAGQYSPVHVQNVVETLEVPCFVSIVGKIKSREYEDRFYFVVAAESINVVDEKTYNHWIAETEDQTAARMETK